MSAKKAKSPKPTAVEAIQHKDERLNLPTPELSRLAEPSEPEPEVRRYPRRPELDPQLVWKGKDQEDEGDLAVPIVPLYLQEKIHPQMLIEEIRKEGAKEAIPVSGPMQADLFAPLKEHPDPSHKIEFYQHAERWANRLVLGDSLLVMTSLAEKEGLKGQVQTVYFDPPYGINFSSNWQATTDSREVKEKFEDSTRQIEQLTAYRDTWKHGIHSYLSYLRDRLQAAHALLHPSGSIFLQIGDENVHLVRSLLDEVFGRENFICQIVFQKAGGVASQFLSSLCDFILWYGKDKERTKFRQLYLTKDIKDAQAKRYKDLEAPDGARFHQSEIPENTPLEVCRRFTLSDPTSQGFRETTSVPFEYEGKIYDTGKDKHWKTSLEGMKRLAVARRLEKSKNSLRYVRYLDDFPAVELNSVWTDIGGIQSRVDPKIYVVQTSTTAVQRCILMTSDPGDVVLDPTCGSGTTAVVSEQWGRRWIAIDTSRVALALARARLMGMKYPAYTLVDSPEGWEKETAAGRRERPKSKAEQEAEKARTGKDVRKGFVCKRIPHITLGSIANNPEIREGMSRKEIESVIARHAENEVLVDQPEVDEGKVRVTGPFTVESISPHRMVDVGADRPKSERQGGKDARDFLTRVLEALRESGLQTRSKEDHIHLKTLERKAGEWLQGWGTYEDKEGRMKKVAVAVGPEHGTVGPTWVWEAAKEAAQGEGADLLAICGFAFDPLVGEESKKIGRLRVLPVRMNADLLVEGLTGKGNLFLAFGEPDLRVSKRDDGLFEIEVRGLDSFDPMTGLVQAEGVEELACWFVDTDYNGECFVVRQAYFTGKLQPYKNLKETFKEEVEPEAWDALYRTTSRPFEAPAHGKVAVKVINHFGDEVLKVCDLSGLMGLSARERQEAYLKKAEVGRGK